MRLVGRFGLVCAKLAAAGFLVTGAAACAGVAAAPAAVPHSSAAPASTAPAGGGLDGQPAFVTAGPAVDRRARRRQQQPDREQRRCHVRVRGCRLRGYRAGAGNPDGHAAVPAAGLAVDTSHPDHVIGDGSPAGCTSAAVVQAVAEGGIITFDCGPSPVTITMTATAKVVNTSHQVVLDGGGKVTLSGGGDIRILYMNTCDAAQTYTTSDCWEQQWPQLVVQNMTLADAYSATMESKTASYGGGAIFDQGGQLKVVDSVFTGDQCYASGPDLGGGAIRATGMDMQVPVYITHDTFTGNSCSNGAALSGLYANFAVYNSLMTGNKAIGSGANPAASGTRRRRQRRRDLYRRRRLQPARRRLGDERQHRPRGRRRHLLRRRRRRRNSHHRRFDAVGQSERRLPERPGIFDEVNSVVTQPAKPALRSARPAGRRRAYET